VPLIRSALEALAEIGAALLDAGYGSTTDPLLIGQD